MTVSKHISINKTSESKKCEEEMYRLYKYTKGYDQNLDVSRKQVYAVKNMFTEAEHINKSNYPVKEKQKCYKKAVKIHIISLFYTEWMFKLGRNNKQKCIDTLLQRKHHMAHVFLPPSHSLFASI